MPISVITRGRTLGEVESLLRHLPVSPSEDLEVVAVHREEGAPGSNRPFVTAIASPALRLEARLIGIQNSHHDRILLLDSDQIPESGLIDELQDVSADACIIPERSANRNLVGRLMDYQRNYSKLFTMHHRGPASPAIPRFYRRRVLMEAINRIPWGVLTQGLSHEDSVLYFYAFPHIGRLSLAEGSILNVDPGFGDFLRKSFLYGQYAGALARSPDVPEEIKQLVREVNWNILVQDPTLGLNPGLSLEVTRAILYAVGTLVPSLA